MSRPGALNLPVGRLMYFVTGSSNFASLQRARLSAELAWIGNL